MKTARPLRPSWVWAVVLVTTAALMASGEDRRSDGDVAAGAAAERECLFVEGTAIPRLAMGVCRLGDPADDRDRGQLELWADTSPAPGEEPAAVRPLFVPMYVYEERLVVDTMWYRLGDAYAATGGRDAGGPLGWVDSRRLHLFASRYAYHFSNPKRVKPGVQLYRTREAAYAALVAQQARRRPADADADVLVAERPEEDEWDPLLAGAVPPFVELADVRPGAGGPEATLTDTTLTFPQPEENRLIRLGAVCGGPVDREKLAAMRKEAQSRAGIEIAFVIDETLSMERWFPQVADFIEKNLAGEGDATNVKVAVSWYSDRPQAADAGAGPPANAPGSLETLVGPDVPPGEVAARKRRIVEQVRGHRERPVRGDSSTRELVFEGLVAAVEKAGFTAGENAMVFVIGDAADRSSDAELDILFGKVADLIRRHNLQLAFIQVGDPEDPDRNFVAQAERLRGKLPPDRRDAVMVQAVNNDALAMRIADIQARMNARRQVLLREIGRIEARNRYSKPGPAMERLIEADGLTLRQFDDRNLQYFIPAYGWLYHPRQPEATPQLRELVFMATPEEEALAAALVEAARQIRSQGRLDADAAVRKLAAALSRNSRHSQIERVLLASWAAMPEDQRTLGAFLRDVLGLRVRNAILYHRGETRPCAATERAAKALEKHAERANDDRERSASRAGLPAPVWRDAWKVLP